MAAYKDLVGQKITKVTSNPGEPKTGQMWYNSTDGKLRGLAVVEAFSSGANMITARRGVAGSFAGSQSSGLGFGGYTGSNTGLALTEEYNGSGWATGGALNKARYAAGGAGTQTAGLCFGGYSNPNQDTEVEEYNGTSWSEETDLPTAISSFACAVGTQTAALNAGGMPAPRTTTFEYDGSSWTATGALNTARQSGFQGAGTQTAAFAAGGDIGGSPGVSLATEEYDGSSWTSVSNCPPTIAVSAAGSGTQTDAILMKGTNSATYDGTNFTAGPSMANDFISKVGNGATTSTAMAFSGNTSGNPTSYTGTTEEFNRSINTITAAAWSSGGAAPGGLGGSALSGTKESAQQWGGDNGGGTPTWPTTSYSYNGSTWTSAGSIPSGHNSMGRGGSVSTAVLSMGHSQTSGATETWEGDGSSWSSGNALNTGRAFYGTGCGPQTAAVGVGGNTAAGAAPGKSNAHENYDGTNWTSKTVFPTTADWVGSVGTQTALMAFAGFPYNGNSWDGSSWTAAPSNSMNRPNFYGGSGGASATSAYIFGGYFPPSWANTTYTEHFDGTSWATQPNMATARGNFGGAGTSSNGLLAGSTYPNNTAVEEFTTETTAINVKTLTQS